MLLKRKKLYEVKNKENKYQSDLILFTSEYRVEFLEYAKAIWWIK